MNGLRIASRTIALALLVSGFATRAAAEPAGGGGAAGKKKIVLVGHKPDHPHGTHMYLEWCGLIAKCLQQTPGVEAVVSDGWPKDPAVLEGVAAIALYCSPGADLMLTGETAKPFDAMMKKGVGFTAIHWATGVKAKDLSDPYQAVLGGYWKHNVGLTITSSKVEQTAKDHPICRGWSDYDLKDEFYLNPTVPPAAVTLFKVRVKGKADPEPKDLVVAWAYERPDSNGGRSYGNTLGHFHENLGIEPFRRALVNGILWTARVEIPKEGAPCALSEEDLKLSPAPAKRK